MELDDETLKKTDNSLLKQAREKNNKDVKNVIELQTKVIESKRFWKNLGFPHVYDLKEVNQIVYNKSGAFKLIDSYDPIHVMDGFDASRLED